MHDNQKKIYVTEEHLLDNCPATLQIHHKNILYFIENFVLLSFKLPIQINKSSPVFVAKVKKIKDGLLFVMTNFVFIFDFNDGTHVAIAQDGTKVFCFDEDGPIEFSNKLLQACLTILKSAGN